MGQPVWKPSRASVTGNYGQAVSEAAKKRNDARQDSNEQSDNKFPDVKKPNIRKPKKPNIRKPRPVTMRKFGRG